MDFVGNYFSFQQWKNFENPLRIDKVIALSLVYYFLLGSAHIKCITAQCTTFLGHTVVLLINYKVFIMCSNQKRHSTPQSIWNMNVFVVSRILSSLMSDVADRQVVLSCFRWVDWTTATCCIFVVRLSPKMILNTSDRALSLWWGPEGASRTFWGEMNIVGQIGKYFAWQHLVYQAGNLEFNSSFDRQPMKLTQY